MMSNFNEKQLENIKKFFPEIKEYEKLEYSSMLPFIRKMEISKEYKKLGYSTMQVFLKNGIGISKGHASDLCAVASKCFNKDGTIIYYYQDYSFSALRIFSKLMVSESDIRYLIDNKYVTPRMSRNTLEVTLNDIFSEYVNIRLGFSNQDSNIDFQTYLKKYRQQIID